MKITSLELINFRSYARSTLTLGQLTFICGPNGVGKSTVVDAVSFGVLGKCRGLDGQNREIAELVRESQTQGLGVRVDVDGVGGVQRTTDGANVFLKVADWVGSNKAQQGALLEYLGTTEEILAACLDSEAFLALHHADAKRLIMGVLNVRIPAAPLEPLGIAGPLSLEELERHYKIAFDKRTGAKRSLDEAHVWPMPEGDEPPPLEDLTAEVQELREQERDLLLEGAEDRGRLKALTTQLAALQDKLKTTNTTIRLYGDPDTDLDQIEEALRAHAATHEPVFVFEPATYSADELATNETEAQEASTITIALADDRGRLRMISDSVGKIEAHTPEKGCVIDSSIPCLTPAKEFTGKLKTIKSDIRKLEKVIAEHTGRAQWLEAQAAGRRDLEAIERTRERTERDAHDRAVKAWRDQKADLDRQRAACTARASSLQTAQGTVLEHMAEIARVQTEMANRGEVREPEGLAALRARLTRGEGILQDVRAWFASRDRHQADVLRTADLRASVEALEQRCAALGPTGLIVDALEQARVGFEATVNRALAKWGYALALHIDPWTVRVNGRKSTQLSKSQRFRVGIALQLAIAEITGVWFVAIDQADMLDAAQREILQDVIDGWPGQIIVCATKDPGFVLPAELPDGVEFYLLELRDDVTTIAAA